MESKTFSPTDFAEYVLLDLLPWINGGENEKYLAENLIGDSEWRITAKSSEQVVFVYSVDPEANLMTIFKKYPLRTQSEIQQRVRLKYKDLTVNLQF